MTRALLSRLARPAPPPLLAEPSLTLTDLVAALCAGLDHVQGLEAMLDRVEGRPCP